ncbi:MAG: DUF58 domain-containing protein [Janthinobacterium lividum]
MRLTTRFVVLIALGALPLLFVGLAPWLLTVVLLYNAVLLACTVADFLAAPKPEQALSLTRTVDDKLSLGAVNRVTIEAQNRSTMTLRLRVRDLPPPVFDLDSSVERDLILPPGPRPLQFAYHVTPPAKGDFSFGDLFFQYSGRLGLIRRQGVIAAAQAVKVYPNLVETAKYELLARRGRLMQLGIRTAKVRGGGSEFESLREYVPGDEYKKIDWSATARRGKLITRQYEAERSQNIVLMLDTGRNMLQSVQKMAKLDYVVNTALMLAYVAAAGDDKVGLMAFDADVRVYLPPAKSKAQVYGILESLYNLNARVVETDYKAAFQNLATRWRRRSLIVLFSDLVDPDSSAQILDAVPMLSDSHRVVCVTVSDPNILAAAHSNPEDSAGVYQKAVATQVLQERRAAISILKRRGVWTIDSPPEELSADLINHYLDLKARSLI